MASESLTILLNGLSYYLAAAVTDKRPNYLRAASQHEAGLLSVPHQPT